MLIWSNDVSKWRKLKRWLYDNNNVDDNEDDVDDDGVVDGDVVDIELPHG